MPSCRDRARARTRPRAACRARSACNGGATRSCGERAGEAPAIRSRRAARRRSPATAAAVRRCIDLIEARTFDLYDDPMPTRGDLEGYRGETSSALIRLASLVLVPAAATRRGRCAGHAGVAYAITGLLRPLPLHARRGQCFLPRDILARHGVTRDDVSRGAAGRASARRSRDARRSPRQHLAAHAERARGAAAGRPARLPAAGAWSPADLDADRARARPCRAQAGASTSPAWRSNRRRCGARRAAERLLTRLCGRGSAAVRARRGVGQRRAREGAPLRASLSVPRRRLPSRRRGASRPAGTGRN